MDSKWFEDARFGMFIHWGLYSLTGGSWKGMHVPWVAEWIMRKFKIPIREYEALAREFDPVDFNADEWAKAAAGAGMKYMVITAKHHDGFAMYHSACDKFNIVDSTPFGRDPMAELAESCRKYGLKLGFYYSQDQDWHEEGATGNTWDFPESSRNPEAFQAYLDRKVKPQVRELLTNYGDICILWFDTPRQITPEQSEDLKNFVHSIQPGCLVSGRVGNGKGDYQSLGDNVLPSEIPDHPCEALGTMNESWGYKSMDLGYKTPEEILRNLCRIAAKSTNYLLNVGPDGRGRFPEQAQRILQGCGDFLQKYGEALYGSTGLKRYQWFEAGWGNVTVRDNNLYFWIFDTAHPIHFYGLRNTVTSVTCAGEPIRYECDHNEEVDYHRLTLLPPAGLPTPCVIKVVPDGPLSYNVLSYGSSDFKEFNTEKEG